MEVIKRKTSLPSLVIAGLIIISIFSLLVTLDNVYLTLAQDTLHDSYAYMLNLSISPEYVYVLNETFIMVIGSLNGSSVVQVLDISNPYVEPRVIQTYPLVGTVTAVATNGFPVERIAVGTDEGDVVIFKINGGKITGLLHAIKGTDFAIRKLIMMKSSSTYKLAILADESQETKGLCISCQVYIFDEDQGNAFRIGPIVGNATLSFDRVYPQDITAALVIGDGTYYYDASKFVVTWVPYQKFYTVEVNITYLGPENELLPGTDALVEIVAYNQTLNVTFRYGVNADKKGIADVLVPMGYQVNLTLRDIQGKEYTLHVDPRTFPPGVTSTYVFIQLLNAPITYPATAFYRTPEYMLAAVDILDVSAVPNSYLRVKTLGVKINPQSSGISLLKGINSPIYALFYHDPETGLAYVRVYDEAFNELSVSTDYVGKTIAKTAFTFPDGKLVVTGYEDGKVKYYKLEDNGKTYKFFQELVLGGSLVKFYAVPYAGLYYCIAYSTYGLQIMKTFPYQIPLLREGVKINYKKGDSIDGDVLGNLKIAVIVSKNEVTVVKGLDKVIEKNKPVDLDSISVPTLRLQVVIPEGEELAGTIVTLQYPGGVIIKNLTGDNNVVSFANIIPFRNYTITVNHPEPYITSAQINIYPTSFEDIFRQVILDYKEFKLKISVQDDVSGVLIAPYQIMLDDNVVMDNVWESQVELDVVFGNHTLTIAPAKGFENVYEEVVKEISVVSDTKVNVTLARKKYSLEVMVIDSRSETPIAPLLVNVSGLQEKIISFGGSKALFEVPYGNYSISVKPLKGYENIYEPVTTEVSVSKPTVLSVTVTRKHYIVNISVRDVTTGFLTGVFDVYVNGTKMLSGIKGQANITLEYGAYEIRVKPSPTFENVYKESFPELIKVTNDTSVEFSMSRKFYSVTVYVFDDTGTPIKNAEVAFFSIDKGSYISTLITDDAGAVHASMFYGDFRLDISATGYFAKHETVKVDKDMEIKIVLQPEPITLIFRYMPVAVIVIIAGIAVIIVLKVRAKIVERLSQSEELF